MPLSFQKEFRARRKRLVMTCFKAAATDAKLEQPWRRSERSRCKSMSGQRRLAATRGR